MTAEDVLKEDPAFADLLHQRETLTQEVQKLEEVLHVERDAVLQAIQQQRQALRARERTVETEIQALEGQLDPARDTLRAKLRDTGEQLRRAEATLKSLRRTRSELTQVTKQAQALEAIEPQIAPLEAQCEGLRQRRRLLRAELRLLDR